MGYKIKEATILETFEPLEWLLVATPTVFLAARLLKIAWLVRPVEFCVVQFALVCLMARREKHRAVGAPAEAAGPPKTLSQKVYNFFFSTQCGTDRHKPTKTFIKGLSCWLFAYPAVDLILTYKSPGLWDSHEHEVFMLFGQCVFSFMADHVMVPRDSAWHPADRWSAFVLTAYGAMKPFIFGLNFTQTICSWCGVGGCCVYFAMVARRHHGLPTHHLHHALFHVVATTGWNYSSLCLLPGMEY
ncbi:hypothetical protein DIPPA_15297 [Diplonema papillatum]|nr:hypothetical protein DIPPA_15297 [Diplonema papillatum]